MPQKRPSKEDDALRREIRTLHARFAKLSQVSRGIAEIWDLDAVLQEIVDGARLLANARYGAVGVFDSSGRVREFITSGITPEERGLLGDLPRGLGLLGYLNEIQEPLRLADLTQHSSSVGFPENHPPMRTFLGAPIRHRREPVGNIFLTEKEGGEEFSEDDEEILVMFASQAAIAIVNALRHKEEQRSRDQVETERRRLARAGGVLAGGGPRGRCQDQDLRIGQQGGGAHPGRFAEARLHARAVSRGGDLPEDGRREIREPRAPAGQGAGPRRGGAGRGDPVRSARRPQGGYSRQRHTDLLGRR